MTSATPYARESSVTNSLSPRNPPAAVLRAHRPLDHQQVGAGAEARDHDVAGPDARAAPDQQGVAVAQRGRHRGPFTSTADSGNCHLKASVSRHVRANV